jgi:rod shape determining protein RodA
MNREGFTGYTRGEARTRMANSLSFDTLGPLTKIARLPWGIILLILAMALVGAGMLFSVAWDPVRDAPNPAQSYLWRNHIERSLLAMGVMLVLAITPLSIWARLAVPAYLVTLVLLVLVNQFGTMGGGAQRWLQVGPVQIQPSEFAKLAVILAVARYYHILPQMRRNERLPLAAHLVALAIILLPAGLVFIQPDFGTTLALVAAGIMIIFFAGLSGKIIGGVVAAGLAAVPVIYIAVLEPYQRERVDTFLAGLTGQTTNGLGESYQIEQAKIAIGAGSWNGRGFLNGIQSQQDYVPEQHTDFILTIIAEEFGFIGAVGMLTVFAFLIGWSFYVGISSRSWFGRFAAIGAASTIAFYTIFNVAMVIGLLPVVGMPLPLISYGGTALLTVMASFGLIISVYMHRDDKVAAHGFFF